MVKLRHINGNDLSELERQLGEIRLPIVVHSITKDGSNWYIHFLVQGIHEEKQPVKNERAKKTKVIRS